MNEGKTAFTLTARRWYAMLAVLSSGEQHASPVWVIGVNPHKTGKCKLSLHFWHANYPAGVQEKTYPLRVQRREAVYLLAERTDEPDRSLVLLSGITAGWLREHFQQQADGDMQAWLDSHYGHP